ncbi:MAG: HD domain-containing phosphohydrolase [Holophaga sp.]|nr:HD domain-containing phosphohydrolase [Holophaga sp.]
MSDQLTHRLSQLLYRCLEDIGSTKAALYLAPAGFGPFHLVTHYGWPRATPPPQLLASSDPLMRLAHRERRCFVLNDGASYPELQAFSQGKQDPRYLIAPIYDHGEWIGLLLQRDHNGSEPYNMERQEAPTQLICQEIVQAIKYFNAPAAPAGVPEPLPDRTATPIRVPAPPTFPEQRSFFWEAAHLLCQVMPAAAVALWIFDPMEDRPILAYSGMPLSSPLERQIITLAQAQRPDQHPVDLQILTKAEHYDRNPIPGPFRTLLPIMLEEEFGKADLLMVFRVEDNPFLPHEQEFIRGLARMLGLFLEEGRLHERYHQSFLSVSHRILASAGTQVPYIREHSLNTAELSRSLARRLELPSPEVEAVTISAILHDVGTLLLDRRILDKPTLSPEDRSQVQTHPILASTFLKDFHFPFDILRIIRHHHEQWDGQGYPDGIAGEAIPIESRIIHLVESFQVMTTGSNYRAAKSMATALAEIRQLSGIHFDPRIVEEFIQMLESRKG